MSAKVKMSLSEKVLQRKRDKKRKKKAKNKVALQRAESDDHNKWPFYECWMAGDLWESGLGEIIVVRKSYTGDFVIGVYLLDVFCLGIKDSFLRFANYTSYKFFVTIISEAIDSRSGEELVNVEAVYAHSLMQQCANYAAKLGLKPHKSFNKTKKLLHDIAIDDSLTFNFGKDGKPLYIPGPQDSQLTIEKTLRNIENACKFTENC